MKRLGAIIAMLCLVAACSGDKAETASSEPAAAPAAAASSETPGAEPAAKAAAAAPGDTGDQDIEIADSDVPVAADFEEEAEKGITKDNYAKALDQLASEIDSE